MSLPDAVLEQVDARLDGELDEAAWAALQARHGAALDVALERARALRATVAALPRPPAPPGLAAAVRERLASVAATPAPRSRGLPWWVWSMPLAAAAALAISILLPRGADVADEGGAVATASTPEPATAAAAPQDPSSPATMIARREISRPGFDLPDSDAAPVKSADRARIVPVTAEPETLAKKALPMDAVAEKAQDEPIAPKPASLPAAPPRAEAPILVGAAPAPAPIVVGTAKAAAPATDAHQRKDDMITEQELAALARDARAFGRQTELAKGAPPAMPAEVAREAARRGSDDATTGTIAPGAVEGGPVVASDARPTGRVALRDAESKSGVIAQGGAAMRSASTTPTELRLGMAMQVAADREGRRHLLLALRNEGRLPITDPAALIEIEGLDARDAVTWRSRLPRNASLILQAGEATSLDLQLGRDLTPPAGVVALRLRRGQEAGEALRLDALTPIAPGAPSP